MSSESATTSISPAESGRVTSQSGVLAALLGLLQRGMTLVTSVGAGFVIFGVFAVQGIVLARLLGPTARGEFSTIVFYTQLTTYLGMLGATLSIARWSAQHPEERPALTRAATRLGLFTGVGTMLLVCGLAWTALPADKAYLAPLCCLAALFLPFEHIRQAILAVDHGASNFGRYNVNRVFAAAVFPVFLLVLLVIGERSLAVVAGALGRAAVVGLLFQLYTQRDARTFGPARPQVKTLLWKGRSYAGAIFATDLFGRLDMLLMLWMASFTNQGYYAAAVPAVSALMVAPHTLHLFAFNAGADRTKTLSWRRLAQAAALICGFQAVSALFMAVAIGPLMLLVFGDDFCGAIPFALMLLPAYAVGGVAYFAEGYLQGRGKATVGVYARVAGAVALVVTALALYAWLSEMSIPVAAIAGNAVSAVVIAVAVVLDVREQRMTPAAARPGEGIA
jgi:antigen flippase